MPRPQGVKKGASDYVRRGAPKSQVRRSGEFSWKDAPEGTLLYEGDQVREGVGYKSNMKQVGARASATKRRK